MRKVSECSHVLLTSEVKTVDGFLSTLKEACSDLHSSPEVHEKSKLLVLMYF